MTNPLTPPLVPPAWKCARCGQTYAAKPQDCDDLNAPGASDHFRCGGAIVPAQPSPLVPPVGEEDDPWQAVWDSIRCNVGKDSEADAVCESIDKALAQTRQQHAEQLREIQMWRYADAAMTSGLRVQRDEALTREAALRAELESISQKLLGSRYDSLARRRDEWFLSQAVEWLRSDDDAKTREIETLKQEKAQLSLRVDHYETEHNLPDSCCMTAFSLHQEPSQ